MMMNIERGAIFMSRTQKDSRRSRDTVLEVASVGDDAFDLFLNRELYRSQAPESALPDWLCVRYGYCGEEYNAILQEVKQHGRKVVIL
jgi:hypothetical protein